MAGAVKHGSDRDGLRLGRRLPSRSALRPDWKIRPVETAQDPAGGDAGLTAESADGHPGKILPVKVDHLDDHVLGENEVCLHGSAAPERSASDLINNHQMGLLQPAKNNIRIDNTTPNGAANIAAMPIRSRHPDRRYLEVGQRIEAVRLFAGLTTIEMAVLMGISQGRYTTLHYGRALPDAEKLEPLCERFGVSLDWLYRGDSRLMPMGIWEGVKAQLEKLVDEHGHPHHRPPGRPVGTGGKKNTKATAT